MVHFRTFPGLVVKLVDTQDLGSCIARCEGSSPSGPTIHFLTLPLKIIMFRSGIGFDTHRLVEDRKLILGGIEIPHAYGLLGHSDADVLTHAIMDALLGAIAAGDIGQHFPDTDDKWKGADSVKLLEAVTALLLEKGWRINNVDATVLAERPKLMPHLPAMREKLALAMQISTDAVSLKATTVEGLGAIGRREGISAMAVATVVPAS